MYAFKRESSDDVDHKTVRITSPDQTYYILMASSSQHSQFQIMHWTYHVVAADLGQLFVL